MPLRNFLKTKRKLRMDSSSFQAASKGANVNNSEILSKPFPPLSSKAKSPTAVLDIVGHPRLSNRSTPDLTAATTTTTTTTAVVAEKNNQQQQQQQPVATKPRRASVHSITSVKLDSKNKSLPQPQQVVVPATSPLPLIMPVPKNSVPPTRRMLQRSGWGEKTEMPSAPGEQVAQVTGPIPITSHDPSFTLYEPNSRAVLVDDAPNTSNQDESIVSKLSQLDELYQQLQLYKQEQEVWARREDEHRQREQWMRQKLQETQMQLQQLWNERQQRDQEEDATLNHSPRQQHHTSDIIYYSEDDISISTRSVSEDDDDNEGMENDGAMYYSRSWESSRYRPHYHHQRAWRRTGSASMSRKFMRIPRCYYYDNDDEQDHYNSDPLDDDDDDDDESFGYSTEDDEQEEMIKHRGRYDYHGGRRWVVRAPSQGGRRHHQATRFYPHLAPSYYMPLELHQRAEMRPPPPHMIPNRNHMRSRHSVDATRRRRSRASSDASTRSDPNLSTRSSSMRARAADIDPRYTSRMHPWMASAQVLH